jgi:hypothetical protein
MAAIISFTCARFPQELHPEIFSIQIFLGGQSTVPAGRNREGSFTASAVSSSSPASISFSSSARTFATGTSSAGFSLSEKGVRLAQKIGWPKRCKLAYLYMTCMHSCGSTAIKG